MSFNPRTYKGGGGGLRWVVAHPKVFVIFSREDETSKPLVFYCCSFIPRAHFETSLWRWSVTMDTRYDVISSRWSSHFWVKMHVFQLLSGTKEKLLDKIMQSNYLCVVSLVKRKKLLIVTVFTCFLVLEKIQDGDQIWWRHRPPAVPPRIKYTSSYRECQKLSTEGKIEMGGGELHQPQPLPSALLFHGESMTLRVRRRVKPAYNSEWREIWYGLVDN